MAKSLSTTLICRQDLFREQVTRFARCEERRPTLREIRQLWRATGFRTA